MKVSKYSIIVTSLVVVLGLIFVIIFQSPRHRWLNKNQMVVEKTMYDSLVAIANKPPIVIIDTIRDTIKGETIYRDKLVPVYLDSIVAVYKDTIGGTYFNLYLEDSLQLNRIKNRSYSFDEYPETIIKYITKEVPVIQYVDRIVELSPKGLYYGATTGFYTRGFSLLGDLTYQTKNYSYFGFGAGVMTSYDTKLNYYPTISLKIGKRFK
jgi:hypothetical protein